MLSFYERYGFQMKSHILMRVEGKEDGKMKLREEYTCLPESFKISET